MISLDTDVLAVYHVFHSDRRYETTKKFFDSINDQTKTVTIFTSLELCGIFSCANRSKDSKTFFDAFIAAEDVIILFPDLLTKDNSDFWSTLVAECFTRIQKGMRLGDAAILWTLESHDSVNQFITWNARHFKEKTSIKISTPSEFLQTSQY